MQHLVCAIFIFQTRSSTSFPHFYIKATNMPRGILLYRAAAYCKIKIGPLDDYWYVTQQKNRPLRICFLLLELSFLRNDFSLVVGTTSFAYSVRHHQRTTFAAFYQVRSSHFPVCSSFISSGFRWFILWTDGHQLHLLKILKYITDNSHSGI